MGITVELHDDRSSNTIVILHQGKALDLSEIDIETLGHLIVETIKMDFVLRKETENRYK